MASVLLFVIVCVPALAAPKVPEPVNDRLSPLTPEVIVRIELFAVVVLSYSREPEIVTGLPVISAVKELIE